MSGERKSLSWMECALCASKPGSPTLCAACLNNRALEAECAAFCADVGRLGRLVEQAEARVGEFRELGAKERQRACDAEAERDALQVAGDALAAALEDGGDMEILFARVEWRKVVGREK